MRICVYGLGAVGGFLAHRLSSVRSIQLCAVARGRHFQAVRKDGLALVEGEERRRMRIRVSERPEELGVQDVVLACLKAQDCWTATTDIARLLTADSLVVGCQNGIPWWHFDSLDGPWNGTQLPRVDPGDWQRRQIGVERSVGCTVFMAGEIEGPGVVRHLHGNRFELGTPSGKVPDRLAALVRLFQDAGLEATVADDIRAAIWTKLLGNLSLNPVSALTRSTMDALTAGPRIRSLVRSLMQEAVAVAESVGIRFPVTVDERLAALSRVGAHRTSMLQDLEAGKNLEIDALMGVVQDIARLTGVPTPSLDTVLALTEQLDRSVRERAGSGC